MVAGLPEVVALADEFWLHHLDTAQLWNIDRGDVDQIERWEDFRPSAVTMRVGRLEEFATRANALRTAGLCESDQSLLATVAFSASATATLLPIERDLSLVAGPFNFPSFVSALVPAYVLTTAAHGDGYVNKLRAMPAFIDGWMEGLRDGLAHGSVATARGVARTIDALDALLARELVDDPLAKQSPPEEASTNETATWRSQVMVEIAEQARPAMAKLRSFLQRELLPHARTDDRAGLCFLPGGAEAYDAALHASTSTGLTADRVHDLGLQQLAQLDEEYRELGGETFGIRDPDELRRRLTDDPSLRYGSPEEIISDAMAALGRAEASTSQWFSRVPRSACTAVAIDAGPMAYYTGPSPDGARGGTFYFNTADPSAWTRFQLEVTAFHEAVPGHHLQLALAQEMDLHPVLGEMEIAAYQEGWGLYAERLADEMGLYSSTLQRIGMLTLDSLRAARLVVDTGIHARGWSRDTAVDFLLAHTASERGIAEDEIDRYIATPGQATSYMIGRLEIQRLRALAQQRLGSRFSVRKFHDVVLGGGMTPLPEIGRRVDVWLNDR